MMYKDINDCICQNTKKMKIYLEQAISHNIYSLTPDDSYMRQ